MFCVLCVLYRVIANTTDVTDTTDNACAWTECSAKHNRGVKEVFYEAARVSISARAKGAGLYGGGSRCVIF